MHENLYLSNSEFGFYTRYKYSAGNFSGKISDWGDYRVVPKSGGRSINANQTTMFAESTRVVLSSTEALRIASDGENFRSESAGKITIN
ncbi:MAG: hypothetical protein IJX51_02290 [Clostridia bacterium]|nr:hypothetical protein [Clostridia bacterium]